MRVGLLRDGEEQENETSCLYFSDLEIRFYGIYPSTTAFVGIFVVLFCFVLFFLVSTLHSIPHIQI